jgi:hypothetical protein
MTETPNRYRFDTIFNYYPDTGIIIPRFNVNINNVRVSKGLPIIKSSSFNGLNLFNYVGRAIAGIWNRETRELSILGFY